MRKIILASAFALCPVYAWANCATTYSFKDASAASQAACAHTDGGGATLITGFNIVDVTGSNALSIDASNQMKANVSALGGTALVTGGVNGTLGVGGLAASGATASGNPLMVGGVFNTTQPTVTNGQAVDYQATARGAQIVATGVDAFTATLGAGSAIAGKFGVDQTTPGTTNAVQEIPGTSGGLSVFSLQPTASDNHTNVKNGAGQLYGGMVFNNSGTVNYLRFYNVASGFNGCGSATGYVFQAQIPANTSVGGFTFGIPGGGLAFSTGISICVTSGYSTTDTTNATASAMSVSLFYK